MENFILCVGVPGVATCGGREISVTKPHRVANLTEHDQEVMLEILQEAILLECEQIKKASFTPDGGGNPVYDLGLMVEIRYAIQGRTLKSVSQAAAEKIRLVLNGRLRKKLPHVDEVIGRVLRDLGYYERFNDSPSLTNKMQAREWR